MPRHDLNKSKNPEASWSSQVSQESTVGSEDLPWSESSFDENRRDTTTEPKEPQVVNNHRIACEWQGIENGIWRYDTGVPVSRYLTLDTDTEYQHRQSDSRRIYNSRANLLIYEKIFLAHGSLNMFTNMIFGMNSMDNRYFWKNASRTRVS